MDRRQGGMKNSVGISVGMPAGGFSYVSLIAGDI